jgi:hypothetical protein
VSKQKSKTKIQNKNPTDKLTTFCIFEYYKSPTQAKTGKHRHTKPTTATHPSNHTRPYNQHNHETKIPSFLTHNTPFATHTLIRTTLPGKSKQSGGWRHIHGN